MEEDGSNLVYYAQGENGKKEKKLKSNLRAQNLPQLLGLGWDGGTRLARCRFNRQRCGWPVFDTHEET